MLGSPWALKPLGLILEVAPSLLLALAFVVLLASIHAYASDEKKLWSQVGLAFAVIYATLVGLVYIIHLTVVLPHLLHGEADKVAWLALTDGSFMNAIDGFGYALMGLATLFAAPVFVEGKLERWIRWLFIANGLLVPVILLALIWPVLVYVGALWVIPISLSTVLLAVLFKRVEHTTG